MFCRIYTKAVIFFTVVIMGWYPLAGYSRSYVGVDTAVLFSSSLYQQFDAVWSGNIVLMDTLKQEAERLDIPLTEIPLRAEFQVNWEKSEDSVVVIRFAEPMAEKIVRTATMKTQYFIVENGTQPHKICLNKMSGNVPSEIKPYKLVLFFPDVHLALGGEESAVEKLWSNADYARKLPHVPPEKHLAAWCDLEFPPLKDAAGSSSLLGGLNGVKAKIYLMPEAVKLVSHWRGGTPEKMQKSLQNIIFLGIGLFFGSDAGLKKELLALPQFELQNKELQLSIELSNGLCGRLIGVLAKNLSADESLEIDYEAEGW